jgi:hypothetical protein
VRKRVVVVAIITKVLLFLSDLHIKGVYWNII